MIDRESLLKPAEVQTREIKGFGQARIVRLSRSKRMKIQTWLRPGGELDDWRKDHFDLRLVTLCLLDDSDNLMFDIPLDDIDGFHELVEQVNESDSAPWDLIIHEVLSANGYLEEVEAEDPRAILGKLENYRQTLIDCLPSDSPESLEFLTLMGWSIDSPKSSLENGSLLPS